MINILTTTPGVDEAAQIDSLALANEIAEKASAEATTSSMSIWDLCFGGGAFSVVLMCLLFALFFVMVFIFVDRFIAIRKATTIDSNFMNRIRDFISEGNIEAAIDLCRRTNSPIARMVEKGIERIGRPMSDIQTAIENVANVEVAKLETSLPWLSSIAGGAPMIGFLGTVVGMVQVFMNMSANQSGAIELSQLSEGMFVAMITTVGGLIVGIPAYFAYNYLVARIEKLVFRMEATTIAFMDILNQPVQK
jgi:biopolymer transport protein ExbB